MPTITITKDQHGKLNGFGEKDRKSYARFRKSVEAMEPGELATIDVWFPRNPKLHGLHFAMLTAIFDSQEQFADPDQLRLWLQVGAGACVFLPGPTGRMVAIPTSISFKAMDDAIFQEHHEAVKAFLRTPHAQMFLWSHLDADKRADMVAAILEGFEQ